MADVNSADWYAHEQYEFKHSPFDLMPHLWWTGIATVEVYKDGRTQPGWGREDFVRNYWLGKFTKTRQIDEPFAYIMRAFSGFVIDIDGKNGGIESAKALNLPRTLAETSKSGNGYHLWYLFPRSYATWSTSYGFDALRDRIDVVPGVDLKAVGCVYHYPQQRWNSMPPQEAPKHLMDLLLIKSSVGAEPKALKQLVIDKDEREIKRLIHDALDTLSRPIPQGRRNQTLFAVGSRLYLLDHKDWEEDILRAGRGNVLDDTEIRKIIDNIPKYADGS